MPLDDDVAFDEEPFDWFVRRLDEAATAPLCPVTLAADEAAAVDHLENERLQAELVGLVRLKCLLPIRLLPPDILVLAVQRIVL